MKNKIQYENKLQKKSTKRSIKCVKVGRGEGEGREKIHY